MFAAVVGLVSLALVGAGAVAFYEYRLYPQELRNRERQLWWTYLGAWLVVVALGLAGFTAIISEAGSHGTIFGVLSIVGGLPALAKYFLNRRLDLERSPLTDRLRERWLSRLTDHFGNSWC